MTGDERSRDKKRLDLILVERGIFESREKARRSIMAGEVWVNGLCEDKPGAMLPADSDVEIRPASERFVSRGGLKLEGALEDLNIDVSGRTVIDVGASTGGFTDCLLRRGARRVYAVDVGRGQLDWRLRQDQRVVVMEGMNIRYARPELFDEKADLITVDVSFISIAKFLDVLVALLRPSGKILLLVKPQFEAGRERVGKHGVVRDPEVHVGVIKMIVEAARNRGLGLEGITFSPIKGPMGNIEFFVLLSADAAGAGANDDIIRRTVETAHRQLSGK